MVKIVLDIPDEFRGLVETWQETLDSMKATLDRVGGGKAVDYAGIERETAIAVNEDVVDDAAIDEWQTEMQLKPMRIGNIFLYTDGLSADDRALTGVQIVEDLQAAGSPGCRPCPVRRTPPGSVVRRRRARLRDRAAAP